MVLIYLLSFIYSDYSSVLIEEAAKYLRDRYIILLLQGLCVQDNRVDIGYALLGVENTDTHGDFFVNFPDERGRPIENQLNATPFCVGFTVAYVRGPNVLMQADNGAPMLTISDTEVEFSIQDTTVHFNLTGIDIRDAYQRLQICANGTDALFYVDCDVMETKPFTVPSSGISYVSILGERNVTTSEYNNFFYVSYPI